MTLLGGNSSLTTGNGADEVVLIADDFAQKITGAVIVKSSPSFTYTSGKLTRIDYPSGAYKEFTYNLDGTLNTITHSDSSVKTLVWSSGVLQSIGIS